MTSSPKPDYVEGYEFAHVAHTAEYEVFPFWLADHCRITPPAKVVDVGCGPGLLTKLLLDRFPREPGLEIVALDPSEFELKLARSCVDDERVTFLQAVAQDLTSLAAARAADCVLLCNVLHMIPLVERHGVLCAAFQILQPGGSLGLNTLFYKGATPPDQIGFYARWLRAAHEYLRDRGIQVEPHVPGPAHETLTPRQHQALLADIGFRDIVVEEIGVDFTLRDWEATSRYSEFIRGTFWPTIDLELGREALLFGLRKVFRHRPSAVRRKWLHIAARK